MDTPTQAEIEDKLRGEDLDAWLDLWRAEQGPAKPGALTLIAAAIPFPIDRSLRVLDVGCGPGDAGRVIHSRFPHAQIDFVDRNLFFVSLCGAVNRRDGIRGRTLARDLSERGGRHDLASDYDVVVAVNPCIGSAWRERPNSSATSSRCSGRVALFCLWNRRERRRDLRRGSTRGKRNNHASTSTKTGGASGRE